MGRRWSRLGRKCALRKLGFALGLALLLAALLAQELEACQVDSTTLCLLSGRLEVKVEWNVGELEGEGRAVSFTDESGFFWFFGPDNLELAVKALDGRDLNGNLWFFYGALSDVEYTITVTDQETGMARTYENRVRTLCGDADTAAFPAGASLVAPPSLMQGPRPSARRPESDESCVSDEHTACLRGGRFAVRAQWRDTAGTFRHGEAGVLETQGDSVPFWFFSPGNVELVVKVLDGRTINDRFWVFFGALSNVEYWVEVTDTLTGVQRVYHNAAGEICGLGDVDAFCDDPGSCGRAAGTVWSSTPLTADALQDGGDLLPFELRSFDLAQDVDAISVHQDFYGIPWDAFADGLEPPSAWGARMQEIATWAHDSDRQIYLSLSVVGGEGRSELEARAIDFDGRLATEDGWAPRCFNFDTHADGPRWAHALRKYVRYMVGLFSPDWLTVGIELNMFRASCEADDPGAWDALVRVVNEAYDEAKMLDPTLPVFPTFQIEILAGILGPGPCVGGDTTSCIETGLERARNLKRDRFAISSYPHVTRLLGAEEDFSSLVDDILARVVPERAVIAETGAPSVTPQVNLGTNESPSCATLGSYDDATQLQHLNDVAAAADRWAMELVTWWSNRDLIPPDTAVSCPCQDIEGVCSLIDLFREILGPDGELVIKMFAGMGLREWDGTEKPNLSRWQELRNESGGVGR